MDPNTPNDINSVATNNNLAEPEEVFLDESEVQDTVVLDGTTENIDFHEEDEKITSTESNTTTEELKEGENEGEDTDKGESSSKEGMNANSDENMVEFLDDSSQGFFTHTDSVYTVALSPATATIDLIPTTTTTTTTTTIEEEGKINEEVSPTQSITDRMAVSGGGDDLAYIWSTRTGMTYAKLEGHTDSISATAFNFDGSLVATAGLDGVINIWDCKDSIGTKKIELTTSADVEWIEWHPKGNVLIAGCQDFTSWMFNVNNGKCMNVFSGHAGPLTAGMFTKDGKKIVTASADATIKTWTPRSSAALLNINAHGDVINSIDISADSSLVASASADKLIKLHNLENGKMVGSLQGVHTDSVETVAFCHTHPYIATGGLDGIVAVWDLNTMKQRAIFKQTTSSNTVETLMKPLSSTSGNIGDEASDSTAVRVPVIQVQFHPTEPTIFTSGGDGKIRQYDGRSGKVVRMFHGHTEAVCQFALANDGNMLITGSDDHHCLVFDTIPKTAAAATTTTTTTTTPTNVVEDTPMSM